MAATEVLQLLAPDGSAASEELPAELDPQRLVGWYRNMVLLRSFDRRALNLQRQGRIYFYAPASGQEAAQIGSAAALQDGDWMFPTYREAGACYQRGLSLQALADQLFGNARDLTKGRQMPNHFACAALRIVSISSPIATQIPQAAGCAIAQKIKRERAATLCYFGDGATSEGDFHAGMNFAGVFRAPCVFFCQNNQWAITVPVSRQTGSESIAIKAKAYGFEGYRVDGNDILAVYTSVKQALDKARAGGGPTLIEALTYRMGPHSTSDDPRRYRSESEVAEWERRDPIVRFERWLRSRGWLDDATVAAIERETAAEVEQAIRSAEAVDAPPPQSLFEDLYAEPTPRLREQQRELLGLIERGVVERITRTPLFG
ncbi:MAG: 3-methyl-2-oxobutanoate dehydrogenase [Planctomycetota bacterium]|nr:MAG: 3-methyl-2-oxobutanoate dehydrogenase [Planctomycetota bacterium]